MIKNATVKILITNRNQKYYNKLGYKCVPDNIIDFKISDLPINSHIEVLCACDICGVERLLSYSKYNKNINRCDDHKIYTCEKCSSMKRKSSTMKKYGVEYISQLDINKERMSKFMSSDEFKEKSRETMIEKYGVDHYSKTDQFKQDFSELYHSKTDVEKQSMKVKRENTCLEKYGEKTPLLNEEIKLKTEKTMFEKYGVRYSYQSDIIFDKFKSRLKEKYGYEFTFNIPEVKEKCKDTIIEKYGVENVFQSEEIKEKIRNYFLDNHGVENSMQVKETINKSLMSKYNRGIIIKNIEEWSGYRDLCRNETNKIKKTFINEWDGYDYYDGEYIKDNFSLYHADNNYPNVDHKISIFEGFINKIDPSDIYNTDNLCITKRINNLRKNTKCVDKFLEQLK